MSRLSGAYGGILLSIAMVCLTPSLSTAQTLQAIADNASYQPTRPHSMGVFDGYAGSAGKTFVTWAGGQMDVWVRACDHATNAWEASIKVKDLNFTEYEAYHNYPAIVRSGDGRLHIFFFDHNSQGYQLSAPGLHSAEGIWSQKTIGPGDGPGYPHPIAAGDSLYLFYRQTISETYRPLKMIRSSNNGATWEASRIVITTGGEQTDSLNEIYPDDIGYEAATSSTPERIRLGWHLAGGAFHNQKTKNVYMAYMEIATGNLTSAKVGLGTTVDASDFANQVTNGLLVHQALPAGSTLQAVSFNTPTYPMSNASNRPLVGFNATDGSGILSTMVARWDGTSWIKKPVPGAGKIRDFQRVNDSTFRVLK